MDAPKLPRTFTIEQARMILDQLCVQFASLQDIKVDIRQFRMGLGVEMEHGSQLGYEFTNITNDDDLMTGRIALAHLMEFDDYYTRLHVMEERAEREAAEHAPTPHMRISRLCV